MKREITWSLMHPTTIDSVYMRRIADEARRYDVDSFEVCGAFANPSGGLNGLLLLEPYPAAAALCDTAAVMRTRKTLQEMVDIAGETGKPLYLWHREIMMPQGMLTDRPDLLDKDGEFDLLGRDFEEFLRYKLTNIFEVIPNIGGVVLTLTEADYSVIHNSDPDRYPPDMVVEKIVRIFAEEHEKYGKRFILRSFGSIAEDYEGILRGARAAAKDHHFDIETKITPYDFDPFLPVNPFLKQQPGTALNAECDVLGEFLGAGYLPAANVENIIRYVQSGEAAGVERYALRMDRIGNCIFDSHEINLYAYHRAIREPGVSADTIYKEWANMHWQNCADDAIALARQGLQAVLKTNFVCGNMVFHKFPILHDWKWPAAGGVIGVYKNNVPLRQLRGNWGILSENDSPGRDLIRQEKQQALQLAADGMAKLCAMQDKLAPEEFAKLYRVWNILGTASQAIAVFTEALCAYFDDLEAGAEHPAKLAQALENAEKVITGLLTDPSETLPTMASCCDGAPLPGDDLDRVYLKGLRILCRELADQYKAEKDLRTALAGDEICDLVLPGSFGDQYRVFRYMHASHSLLIDGVPVRYAGNPVFPNGFIEVELQSTPGGDFEIRLLPGAVSEIKVTVNGSVCTRAVPPDGIITGKTDKALTVIRIEKSGTDYPPVTAIRSWQP